MAFTYTSGDLTSAGVTRYSSIEDQIAILADSAEIETMIETIGAGPGGAAITSDINTAAEYSSLLSSWAGYRKFKKD